eukprot:CAMPEP_0175632866 /NCGR_PEP_ID=MMETSP0097-20121207/345_1 /TAXON_ID=311494 /ORGANISM="Alexandrium monilatum, Strain CCMP3105" /LENGTH=49 /DNA_ID= /DNA_START= /DNA_END= /DNA_ORIENTATION=
MGSPPLPGHEGSEAAPSPVEPLLPRARSASACCRGWVDGTVFLMILELR